jgi:hypothetical protein
MFVDRRDWFPAEEPYPRRTQKEAEDQSENEVDPQQREPPVVLSVGPLTLFERYLLVKTI